MRRHAIVPDVIAYSAAISAGGKCQQHQQALHLLRAMRCHAIVPDVIAYSTFRFLRATQRHAVVPDGSTHGAAGSGCEEGQQRQQALLSYAQGSVMPSCRLCSRTVQSSARA